MSHITIQNGTTKTVCVFSIKDGENKGIRTIYGMSGVESLSVLENAIKILENMTEDLTAEEIQNYADNHMGGYWMPTRENAIKPLY